MATNHKSVHLIARAQKGLRTIDKSAGIYESGEWSMAEQTAAAAVGGSIYLHEEQLGPSYWGGVITGYRIVATAPSAGRVVFTFRVKPECKGLRTDREGWSQEMKLVGFQVQQTAAHDIPS